MNINWNVFAGLKITDLRLLREPVLWAAVVFGAAYWIVQTVIGDVGVEDAVNSFLAFAAAMWARAQVNPPLTPKPAPGR